MSEARARASTLAGQKVRLARHRTNPYQRVYRPALPQRQDIPGDPLGVSSDPNMRYWRIDDWSGGQGNEVWNPSEPDRYNTSQSAGPEISSNRNLVIGPGREDAASAPADEELYLNVNGDVLYGFGDDNNYYAWNSSTQTFAAGVAMGTANINLIAGTAMPIRDGSNDYIYVGYTDSSNNDRIRQLDVISATNAEHYGTAGSDDIDTINGLVDFQGVLYLLDRSSLYTVDQSTTDTRTKVVDVPDNNNDIPRTRFCLYTMTTSDVGPCWLQLAADGFLYIHQYNHFSDTHTVEAKLPIRGIRALSLFHAAGFYFVPYLVESTSAGWFFLFYAQGAQQGSVGPFIPGTANSAPLEPIAVGSHGDEFLISTHANLWSYDLRKGAIINRVKWGGAADTDLATVDGAALYRGTAVVCGTRSGAREVEFSDLDEYDTNTDGELKTGRYDFDYPGINKIMLDVTIVFDPLPANASIGLEYSVDGGTFTSAGSDYTTDNGTSNTWTLSTNTASVVGKDLELNVLLKTTTSTQTPTIRSVTSRATSAVKTLEWRLELDMGEASGGVEGDRLRSDLSLANLKTLAETNAVVQFTDNWFGDEYDTGTSYDVVVMDVIAPEWGTETPSAPFAQVRLRAVDLV